MFHMKLFTSVVPNYRTGNMFHVKHLHKLPQKDKVPRETSADEKVNVLQGEAAMERKINAVADNAPR